MTPYDRGCATRDGFAAEYERRTGQSWYAVISKGRPRRRRFTASEKGLGATGASGTNVIPFERRFATTTPERE